MAIDPDFRKKRKKSGKGEGIAIWGPVNPPEKLGIRGTAVGVGIFVMVAVYALMFARCMCTSGEKPPAIQPRRKRLSLPEKEIAYNA